jgi:hypothetical protein
MADASAGNSFPSLQSALGRGFLVAMRHIVFAVILFVSPLLAGAPIDTEITKLLVGDWDFRSVSPAVKEGTFTFRSDGTWSSHGLFHVGPREYRIDAEGTWQVKNGLLVEKLTKCSDPTTIHIGQITRDKVLSITNNKFRFERDEGTQASYVRK